MPTRSRAEILATCRGESLPLPREGAPFHRYHDAENRTNLVKRQLGGRCNCAQVCESAVVQGGTCDRITAVVDMSPATDVDMAFHRKKDRA